MATNTLAQVQQNSILRTEYWQPRLLEMIKLEESNFILSRLGQTLTLPKNHGTKQMSMRRYNSLPVDLTVDGQGLPLVEGVAPAPLLVNATRVNISVQQHGAYIEETDVEDTIHMDDIKSIYQPELARHASEVRDEVVRASFSDASEYFVGARANLDAVTDADVLTLQDVRKVALYMRNYRRKGHPRFGGKPVLVCHINVMQDLVDDSDLLNNILVPGQENSVTKMGTLQNYTAYGIAFVETLATEITSGLTATGNIYVSYLLGKDPYAVIKLGNTGLEWKVTGFAPDSGDPLGQKATFGYKMWTGAGVVDPLAIWKVYSVSAYDMLADFDNATTGAGVEIAEDTLGQNASQVAV